MVKSNLILFAFRMEGGEEVNLAFPSLEVGMSWLKANGFPDPLSWSVHRKADQKGFHHFQTVCLEDGCLRTVCGEFKFLL